MIVPLRKELNNVSQHKISLFNQARRSPKAEKIYSFSACVWGGGGVEGVKGRSGQAVADHTERSSPTGFWAGSSLMRMLSFPPTLWMSTLGAQAFHPQVHGDVLEQVRRPQQDRVRT